MGELEIQVVDSFRNLPENYWRKLGSFYTRNVWTQSVAKATRLVKDSCLAFEYEYAVKWFLITAYVEKQMVGTMRALRNPEDETRWFFCDVHVDKDYKRQGIASAMYERAFELVKEFGAAEFVEASIEPGNEKSILLHEKFGFESTGDPAHFAHFSFEDGEVMYKVPVLLEYPVVDGAVHRKILMELLRDYLGKRSVAKEVSQMIKNNDYFTIIWCGNRPVGFRHMFQGVGTNYILDLM